jgi:hypothetical protein
VLDLWLLKLFAVAPRVMKSAAGELALMMFSKTDIKRKL